MNKLDVKQLGLFFRIFRYRNESHSRRMSILILVIIALALMFAYGPRSVRKGSDFRMFHQVACDVFSGDDLYEKHAEFMYLPIWPLLIRPLAWMDLKQARIFWFVLNVLLFVVSLPLAAYVITGQPLPKRTTFLFFLCTLAMIYALRSDLKHGNANVIILFLVVLGLALYRRGRDIGAGAFIGLAAVIKITPALFVLYLATRGSYRAFMSAVITAVLLILIIPSMVYGPRHNVVLLQSFYQKMFHPYINTLDVPYVHAGAVQEGQSLPVAATLLLTDFYEARTSKRVHLMALPYNAVQVGVRLACILLVAGLLVKGWRRRGKPRQNPELGIEFTQIICTMLLVSSISRTGHFVVLAFPLMCFFLISQRGMMSAAVRRTALTTLLTAGGLFLGIAVFTEAIDVSFKRLVPYFFTTLTLLSGSLVMQRQTRTLL